MAILSKKTALGVVLLAVVIGGGVALISRNSNNSENKASGNNTTASNTTTAPAKTYDPSDVLKSIQDYKDQDVSLTGSVVQLDKDYYLVGKMQGAQANSIKLDFSKTSIDPSKYANPGSRSKGVPSSPDDTAIKSSVTITGKIIQTSPKAEPYLQVSSIK